MVAVRPTRRQDAPRLFAIWRGAVLATHHFLAAEDFAEIERLVAEEYLPSARLWVAVDGDDRPVGFMGLSGSHVDSLFVDPGLHGSGIGRALLERAAAANPTLTVDVNEQNAAAVGFYERLGFRRVARSPLDGGGRPYPLLHLRMDRAAPRS
jgi:putative acetyltransferase